VRPVATATTGGLGNPVVSTAEDGLSLGMSLLAVFIPVLGALALVGVLFLGFSLWGRLRRRRRAL
jgi:hypothetical protein